MLANGTILSPTPDTIGFEPTFEGYLDHVVRRDCRALKRVMRPDGVLVLVIDDVIANPASIYDEQTYHSNRTKLKLSSQVGFRSQDTTKMRPKGNWLGLPSLFAMAMMDDGWVWRDQIIWDKGSLGRKKFDRFQVPAQLRVGLVLHPQRIRILVRSGRAPHPAGWPAALQCQRRIQHSWAPQTRRLAQRWGSCFPRRVKSLGSRRRRRVAYSAKWRVWQPLGVHFPKSLSAAPCC